MNNQWVILIVVVVTGIGVYGFLRSDGDDYAERAVALDSKEVKQVESMLQQLRSASTNHLAECLSVDVNPIAQQQLLHRAQQIPEASEVKVKQAEWSGDYFRVHVSSPTKTDVTASHWFLLAANEGGALKLLGVQH